MTRTNAMSSYLVRPNLNHRRAGSWAGFSTHLLTVTRSNRHTIPRIITALLLWSGAIAGYQYVAVVQSPTSASAFSSYGNIAQTVQAAHAPLALSKTLPATTPHAQPKSIETAAIAPIYTASYGTYSNTYTPGQCTWYVASRRRVPSNWGNANEWYYHAKLAGWSVGATPKIGAIAWTNAGYYGHVAIVEQVSPNEQRTEIREMNYYGPYIRDSRWVASSAFKYIY